MKSNYDMNEKFRIASLLIGAEEVHLYLLNPGQHFDRFGGRSSGLVVTGTTASLIVRTFTADGGCTDVEYDCNDRDRWAHLMQLCKNPDAALHVNPMTQKERDVKWFKRSFDRIVLSTVRRAMRTLFPELKTHVMSRDDMGRVFSEQVKVTRDQFEAQVLKLLEAQRKSVRRAS